MAILLAAFVVYRLLDALARDFQHPEWASILSLAWLGFVAYTWLGPAIFQKTLRKELDQIVLKKEF